MEEEYTQCGDRDDFINNLNGIETIDGEGVSLIDANIIDRDFKLKDIIRVFEAKIGAIDSQETINKVQKYLPQVFEYEEEHRGIVVSDEIKNAAKEISDKKSLLQFLSGKFLPEDQIGRGRHRLATIWKVFSAFHHAQEEQSYFDDIDRYEEIFKKNFNNLFKTEKSKDPKKPDKKYFQKGHNGKKIYVEIAKHDTKAKWRVIDKLLTKATLNFSDIQDILRGRIVPERKEEKEELNEAFKKTKFFSDYNLKLKTKETNRNKGSGRDNEIKYIKSAEAEGVPIEIQIMDKDEFDKSESYENHHLVYEWIQNLVRDDRLGDLNDFSNKLSQRVIKQQINELAKNKEIRRKLSEKEIKKRILARFNKTFFNFNGSFYSYQNTLRCRNYNLRYRQLEIIKAMFKRFNKEANLDLSVSEWQIILDYPQNADLLEHETITEMLKNIKGVPNKIVEKIQKEVKKRLQSPS